MIEFLTYNLVGLMFLLMVVAPLVNHAAGGPMPGACLMAAPAGTSYRERLPSRPIQPRSHMRPPTVAHPPTPDQSMAPAPQTPTADDGLDIAGVEGRMEAAVLRRMQAIVDDRPREAAAVLRSWLNEDHS